MIAKQQPNRRVGWPWFVGLLIFCLSLSDGMSQDTVLKDGFEAPAFQLECEKLNYPCSLAEADPDARTRALALLDELSAIRDTGTLEDC